MLNLGQVKVGNKIIFRAQPFEVVEANHLKMGRGGAKLVTKLRNLIDQSVIDYTFAGDERLEEAEVGYKAAQFLYGENDKCFFMTNDDFEQVEIRLPKSRLGLLKEGQAVDICFWQNRALDVKLPGKVELEVTYTEPGFKGNTAGTTLKSATLETGAKINVPLFINTGDKVRVNTDTGAYDSRA
ncbi:MAG TPA: elongation factor P [Candidatus Saccharimonadales bacterium]|nr:elongation factor P [Candidatus Saccharimonadales bacterium]